jgi:hypothetical protein
MPASSHHYKPASKVTQQDKLKQSAPTKARWAKTQQVLTAKEDNFHSKLWAGIQFARESTVEQQLHC